MTLNPKISIVCASFNHEKYVESCLRSLLTQTEPNFELIIIDDASTDNNVALIKKFNDPRIKLIERLTNRGVAAGMNDGVRLAKADIVAFIDTDDIVNKYYVEKVLDAFGQNISAVAVYVSLDRMNEKEEPLKLKINLPFGLSRYEILRQSFNGQNLLPSPGMAVKRGIALAALIPEGVVQYSDWILQNRILMAGEIVMIEEKLIRYRVSTNSLSARSDARNARERLETRLMMDDFLVLDSITKLDQVFGKDIDAFRMLGPIHAPYIIGCLALKSEILEKRSWGYEIIMKHLSKPGMAISLQEACGFTQKHFMALAPISGDSPVNDLRVARSRARLFKRLSILLGLLLAAVVGMLLK